MIVHTDHMEINSIIVKHHSHVGYEFVEYNGTFFKGCRRCGGTGHYSFNGFDSICYSCGNTSAKLGDELGTLEDAQKWCEAKAKAQAKRDAKREEERLAKLARRQSAWDQLAAGHPQIWELVSTAADVASFAENRESHITERDNFVRSLADRLWNLDERPYTARQLEVLQAIAEKRATRKEEAAETPAPEGRVVVTGEIVGAKVAEGDYGTAYKVTVKDDRGFRVYVSLPKAQADEAYDAYDEALVAAGKSRYDFGPSCWFLGAQGTDEQGVKGRRITFTAALTPSRDDVSFAFGSRPTKGAWL